MPQCLYTTYNLYKTTMGDVINPASESWLW